MLDAFDTLMLVRYPYMLIPLETAKKYIEACEEKAGTAERKGLEEKVSAWR